MFTYLPSNVSMQFLNLAHHENPALSVLEVATDKDTLIFQQEDLARLAKTWDVTTAVPDEAMDNDKIAPQGPLEVLDFRHELPGDVSKDQYDIICVSESALFLYTQKTAEAVGHICQALKQGGTLCFLATGRMFCSMQHVLKANHMHKPYLQIPSADKGPGLIVFKKGDVGSTNGTSDKLTPAEDTNGTNGESPGRDITVLLASDPTAMALTVAVNLISRLQEHHYKTRVFRWGSDVSDLAGRECISLLEVGKPLLRDLDAADFESLKRLILEAKSLFWATVLDDPSTALIDGLVRVVRNETPGLDVRVFHADEPSSIAAPASALAGLMSRAFLSTGVDNEFRVKGDILQICRAEEDTELNEEIDGLLPGAAKTITRVPLGQIEYPVKLSVQSPGMLSSVCLVADESAEAELEPDFVEIQTKASALK